MPLLPYDIGFHIKPVVGNPPLNAAAGTRNGAAIDRQGFQSCVLFAATGAAEGSPTAQTLEAKLQESADGSTGWTDISGASVSISATSSSAEVNVNLRAVKRYIRVVETISFTGGTSPKLNAQEVVILGGADKEPA